MANVVNNLVSATGNILTAGATTVNVASELVVSATSMLNHVDKAPAVGKQLLKSPFDAGTGYIMEKEGVSRKDAQARSHKYLNQDVTRTIEELSEGSGKLLAELLKEEAS